MPDADQIKEKIVSFLESNGPSLPVHIAGNINQSILFTSAFLSELLSDKRLKISNMRVGSSAIHFIPGQESQLEKFSNYLKSKEKEAFLLLKEKQILKDSEVEPAIRVALRSIKDFAVPFEKSNGVYWRYFIVEEPKKESPKIKTEGPGLKKESQENSKDMEIFDDKPPEKKETIAKTIKKAPKTPAKKAKPKASESARNRFFNKAKDFLAEKGIEIIGIEEIAINRIIFKVMENEEEYLIIAYNKKRINDEDIIKAYKKAEELNLNYKILCLGGTLKKLDSLINASKTLKGIEKIE